MGWQGLHPWAHILQISPLQTGGETPLGSGGWLGTLGCCVPPAQDIQRRGWRPGCEVSRASAPPQQGPPSFQASCWAGDVGFRGRLGIRDAEHIAGVQLGFSEAS